MLYGHGGNDRLGGGAGHDLLHGGSGDDWVAGDAGDDRLYGNSGDDQLAGGAGHDKAFGNGGFDRIEGGAGNDLLFGGTQDDHLAGDEGDDKLYGQAGNDTLDGGGDENIVAGGEGDDIYVLSNLVDRHDVIADSGGDDTVDFSNWVAAAGETSGAQFAMALAGVQTISQGSSPGQVSARLTRLCSIEHVIGTGLEDTIFSCDTADGLVVSTLVDESDGDYSAGDLSLREALLLARSAASVSSSSPQLITFDDALFTASALANGPAELQLAHDANHDGVVDVLGVRSSVVIQGPGAGKLVIRGGVGQRVLHVQGIAGGAIDVEIVGLTIAGGNLGLRTIGSKVTLREVRITDVAGAGIQSNETQLHIFDSQIIRNTAAYTGAGLRYFSRQPGQYSLKIVDTSIGGNVSNNHGGGIFIAADNAGRLSFEMSGSRIVGNTALRGSGLYLRDPHSLVSSTFSEVEIVSNSGGLDVDGHSAAVRAIEATDSQLGGRSSLASSANVSVSAAASLGSFEPQILALRQSADSQVANSAIQMWMRDGVPVPDSEMLARPDLLNQVQIVFNEGVQLEAGALRLWNDSQGGTSVPLDGVSFSQDTVTHTATWDLSSLERLEPGYYTLSLNNQAVTAGGGDAITYDPSFHQQIYVALPGDTNLDGAVDVLNDGFALVANLGLQSRATWADGDFTGDGKVDVLGDGFALVRNLGSFLFDSQPTEPGMPTFSAPANISVRINETASKRLVAEDDLTPYHELSFSVVAVTGPSKLKASTSIARHDYSISNGVFEFHPRTDTPGTWKFHVKVTDADNRSVARTISATSKGYNEERPSFYRHTFGVRVSNIRFDGTFGGTVPIYDRTLDAELLETLPDSVYGYRIRSHDSQTSDDNLVFGGDLNADGDLVYNNRDYIGQRHQFTAKVTDNGQSGNGPKRFVERPFTVIVGEEIYDRYEEEEVPIWDDNFQNIIRVDTVLQGKGDRQIYAAGTAFDSSATVPKNSSGTVIYPDYWYLEYDRSRGGAYTGQTADFFPEFSPPTVTKGTISEFNPHNGTFKYIPEPGFEGLVEIDYKFEYPIFEYDTGRDDDPDRVYERRMSNTGKYLIQVGQAVKVDLKSQGLDESEESSGHGVVLLVNFDNDNKNSTIDYLEVLPPAKDPADQAGQDDQSDQDDDVITRVDISVETTRTDLQTSDLSATFHISTKRDG